MALKTIDSLKQPKGTFIGGNLSEFKANSKHQVLEKWASECGDLFRVRFMTKKFIVSANAELNHEILKMRPDKFSRYQKANAIMSEMGINGVFNVEGENWRKHRKLTTDALSVRNIQAFYPVLVDISNRLLNKWQKAATKNETFDMQEELMRYFVDITSVFAFGYPMNTLEQGEDVIQNHLEKVLPMINARIGKPLPLWKWFPRQEDKDLKKSLAYIESHIQTLVNEGKKKIQVQPERKLNPTNFLEALLVEQDKDASFTDKEVYGNVFLMLLAGEDTSSNTLSWALYFLSQHPEYVEKIRTEANEVYPNDKQAPTFDVLKKLEWAESAIMESLRMKPVVPFLFCQALEDMVIGDLKIDKDMIVAVQNKVAQTNENYFSEPLRFFPERWMIKAKGCPMHTQHSPEVMRAFGGGPRFCPGKTLAMNELVMTISMICKHFNIHLTVPKNEVKEVFAFTMYPQNCLMRLEKTTV